MLATLPRLMLMVWILRRAVLLVALGTGCLSPPAPEDPSWIGVLGGGGVARFERALELQERYPEATVAVVGTRPELVFAARVFQGRIPGRVRYLEVAPGTTRGCVAALRVLAPAEGIVVTDAVHAPRVRLAWLLAGIGCLPTVDEAVGPGNLDPRSELWKSLGYLLLY